MLVATNVCVPGAVPGVKSPFASIVPTVPLPPAIPSTVQLTAPPAGATALNGCV